MKTHQRFWIERGIFARTLTDGGVRYGISYLDTNGERKREIVGSSIQECRVILAERRKVILEHHQKMEASKRKLRLAELNYEKAATTKRVRAKKQARRVDKWVKDINDARVIMAGVYNCLTELRGAR